jgi:large subunit ribosomal protein L22
MPETKATLRYLRTSPTKVREVLGLIRGLEVDEARHVLRFSERGPARDVLKVLNSAVANADHTLNIPADELYISLAYADEGPTIKRWRPRARGRATRIRKRTSHITIVVARLSDEQLQARRRREAVPGQRRRGVLPGRRRRAAERPARQAAGVAKAAGDVAQVPPPEPAEVDEGARLEGADQATSDAITEREEALGPGPELVPPEPGEPDEDEEGK